ncbi:MAG: UvrABC system protein C, partial [candidate division CPR3 bacterium GW2011_GWE2_35_7]
MNFTPKNYKTIPNKPGIYQFSDETKSLLYVGKAKDLQKRVSSYFKKSSTLLPKTKLMVSQIK